MKKIHVYLTGRFGNQLFQYAFARKLQSIYGGKIVCNVYDLEHRSGKFKHTPYKFCYDLNNYKLNSNVEIEDVKPKWYADFYNPITKVIKKIFPKLYFKCMAKKGYLLWQRNDYIEIPKLDCDQIFINGWWQDFRFFQEVEEELIQEVVPVTPLIEENSRLYHIAQEENSVCLSIRGGNYLVPKVKKVLFVCDRDYFINSIEFILKRINNPVFIIFTDDLEWVRNYLKLEERFPNVKFVYESGNDTVEEKIRMMTMCKHFIISNSTFSWWAQYLSPNKDKIVVAPNMWFTDGSKNGLYMDDWNLIDVKRQGNDYNERFN